VGQTIAFCRLSRRAKLAGFAAALLAVMPAAQAADYAIGADLSFLKQSEDRGTAFKDGGETKPGLAIFKDHGYNWIRLRLFHTPTQLPNSLPYTIALAKSAKDLGYKFLLDYHYSDTWADPGKQFIPKAWEGKNHAQLVEAVRDYTRETMAAFREAGVQPDMVQVGVGPGPRIMIHIDKGGNKAATKWFFDKLNGYGIKFDVIGQSYYPWWHGSILDLRENLAFMANEYHKDIIVVEAAYNWAPREYTKKAPPFPESPEGQRDFWEEVNRAVMATPYGLGKGVFWWEPAVSGARGGRGFFDKDGNALPVMSVFDKFTRH
jgi:arabinogalactan endo-1,4-beta-galactosidase